LFDHPKGGREVSNTIPTFFMDFVEGVFYIRKPTLNYEKSIYPDGVRPCGDSHLLR
jgi:hypothetical protein